jgi:hypothetical protein
LKTAEAEFGLLRKYGFEFIDLLGDKAIKRFYIVSFRAEVGAG